MSKSNKNKKFVKVSNIPKGTKKILGRSKRRKIDSALNKINELSLEDIQDMIEEAEVQTDIKFKIEDDRGVHYISKPNRKWTKR